jgi:peptidoglycan/LPS O-acetylase OafA/YrhL
LFLRYISKKPCKHALWDVVSLIGWALLCAMAVYGTGARYLFVFLTVAVYVAAFLGPVSSWLFSRPLLTVCGGMCYTVYLYHSAVISAVGRFLLPIHLSSYNQALALHAVVEIPFIMIISVLLFAYVERPCMEKRWPQRLLQHLHGMKR